MAENEIDTSRICFMCERALQFQTGGGKISKSRYIKSWDIEVCNDCLWATRMGIIESRHPRLMAHLAKMGVKLQYTDGRLYWPENAAVFF